MAARGALALTSACGCAALTLPYRFPPDRFAFYPACPFRQATGLLCPGCGATRAIAALLHGHLAQALTFNLLAIAAFACLAVYAASALHRGRWLRLPTPLLTASLAVSIVFAILRNLP